jgi:Uma2 family endonuclease
MSLVEPLPTDVKLPWRHGAPLTRDDLDRMPDDGHRYELIDGVLVVSPAPKPLHQRVVGNLFYDLRLACPPDLEVLFAPLDVVLSADTVMQADLLVARREDFTESELPVAPLLAVEVLSRNTRRIDLMLKFSRFEAAGCVSYWVVDPDTPSLIAWELRDGAYTQVAKVVGDQQARLTRPYDVTVVPANLIL